jgi:hypothetical protein
VASGLREDAGPALRLPGRAAAEPLRLRPGPAGQVRDLVHPRPAARTPGDARRPVRDLLHRLAGAGDGLHRRRPGARPGVVRRQLAGAELEDPLPRAARAAAAGARPPGALRRPDACPGGLARLAGPHLPAVGGDLRRRRPGVPGDPGRAPGGLREPRAGPDGRLRRSVPPVRPDLVRRRRRPGPRGDDGAAGRGAGLAPLVAARRALPDGVPADGLGDRAVDLPHPADAGGGGAGAGAHRGVAARVLPASVSAAPSAAG